MNVDLDGITPNWDFLPPGVQTMFESAAGTALMIGLGICVIGFVVAGVRLLFARSYGMYGAGGRKDPVPLERGRHPRRGEFSVLRGVAGRSGNHDVHSRDADRAVG